MGPRYGSTSEGAEEGTQPGTAPRGASERRTSGRAPVPLSFESDEESEAYAAYKAMASAFRAWAAQAHAQRQSRWVMGAPRTQRGSPGGSRGHAQRRCPVGHIHMST